MSETDRKQIFPIIASAVRAVLGHCFKYATVTSEQREAVTDLVMQQARDAGLVRFPRATVIRRVDFWLKVHDPAKSLWFGVRDLTAAVAVVTQHVPASTLATIQQKHAAQLGTRTFDHFVLAVALCSIIKNTLIENRRTRKEECGTKALRELLASFGIAANGSLASLCFKTLQDAGLIVCTDSEFEIGRRCRRWVPAGSSWSIPFVANLPQYDLSDRQRDLRNQAMAPLSSSTESPCGYSYRIRSSPITPTTQTRTQTATETATSTNSTSQTGTHADADTGTINQHPDPIRYRAQIEAHLASRAVPVPQGKPSYVEEVAPDFYAYEEEDTVEEVAEDWGPDLLHPESAYMVEEDDVQAGVVFSPAAGWEADDADDDAGADLVYPVLAVDDIDAEDLIFLTSAPSTDLPIWLQTPPVIEWKEPAGLSSVPVATMGGTPIPF